MTTTDIIENIINNTPIPNREINQGNERNEGSSYQTPDITNNINFSNPISDSMQSNNININNYLSQINGLFEFFINPLKKTIANLKDEIKKLKNEIKDKEKKIKDKEERIEELDKKCSVCFTNKSNIIFIPCGHLCMCNDCNNRCTQYNMSFCPICRSNGTRYVVKWRSFIC